MSLVRDRSCGECTACCTAVQVHELRKLEFTPCQHLCPGGCSIYADRPGSCRTYKCLWLKGYLGEEHRPDRWKLILDEDTTAKGSCVRVWELEPGAWEREGIAWQVQKLQQRLKCYSVVLWRYGTRSKVIHQRLRCRVVNLQQAWLEQAEPTGEDEFIPEPRIGHRRGAPEG